MCVCNTCQGEGIINPDNDINTTTLCHECDGSGRVNDDKPSFEIIEDDMPTFESLEKAFKDWAKLVEETTNNKNN